MIFRINDWFQYRDLERQATAIFTACQPGLSLAPLGRVTWSYEHYALHSMIERTREIGLKKKALGATNSNNAFKIYC